MLGTEIPTYVPGRSGGGDDALGIRQADGEVETVRWIEDASTRSGWDKQDGELGLSRKCGNRFGFEPMARAARGARRPARTASGKGTGAPRD